MVEKSATSEKTRPTLAQAIPATAIPAPRHAAGLARIFDRATRPRTSAAMAIGVLTNEQQQPKIEIMPSVIDAMASGLNWDPRMMGPEEPPGGPNPPGPNPPGPPGGPY